MIKIITAEEFEKRYQSLPFIIQKKADKQTKLFCNNPFHPSLNTEKINPSHKELWTFRVDKKYRVIFRFIDGTTVFFLSIGPHDWIYRIRF